jgi:hypothetical protein
VGRSSTAYEDWNAPTSTCAGEHARDLSLADLRLGGVRAQDGRDLVVEIDVRVLPGGDIGKGCRPGI